LSCAAAYAAEAARRQGKFWEYHDALFAATEPLEEGVLRRSAQAVGIDLTRFEADLADAPTAAKVAADVMLGKSLKIIGTPSAFLGKKQLSSRAMAQLEPLIEHELEQANH
jgi:protein-disulfide isomerase